MSRSRQFAILGLILVPLALLLAWGVRETTFSASVIDLLRGEEAEVRILREIAEKGQGRQLTVVLSAEEGNVGRKAVDAFSDSLKRSGAVNRVWKAGSSALTEPGQILFQNRYHWLLPRWLDTHYPDWRQIPPGTQAIARSVADELDTTLDSPDAFAVQSMVPDDPFLLLDSLEGFEALAPNRTPGNTILWVEQKDSPFTEAGQAELFLALDRALWEAQKEQAGLQMEYTGVAVFAQASKEGIKGEIEKLNLLGLLLVLVLSLLVLRSILNVVRIGAVVVSAILAGATTVIVIYESVHIIALVIGSILAGVAVDYAYHLILHERNGLSERTVKKAVVTGSLSSAAGFIILMLSPLPFLQQVGTFVGSGLVAALTFSIILRPHKGFSSLSPRWGLPPFRLPAWTGPILLAVTFPGLIGVHFQDSIDDLEYPLPELNEKDQRIQGTASILSGKKILLAHGEDIIRSRQNLSRMTESIKGIPMVHAGLWIPKLDDVDAARDLFETRKDFRDILMAELEMRGYIPEAFTPFIESWKRYLESPVTEEGYIAGIEAMAHSLPGPMGNFLHIGEQVSWFAVIVPKNAHIVSEGIIELDQANMLSGYFAKYREQVMFFFAICALGILLCLVLVYGIEQGLLSFLLPLGAVSIAYGMLGYIYGGFGLFGIVGGLLSFCICLDYAIFAIQAQQNRTNLPASVTISAMTTVGAFGILATSRIPGIQELALTVFLCIVATLILIAAGWPFVEKRRPLIVDVLDRLPHGPEALMIRGVVDWEGHTIWTEGLPREDWDVPTECLVEAMAQSAAAWLILSSKKQEEKQFGILVVVQACETQTTILPTGSGFTCEVESQSEAREGFLMFKGKAKDAENRPLLTATFSIFIPSAENQA